MDGIRFRNSVLGLNVEVSTEHTLSNKFSTHIIEVVGVRVCLGVCSLKVCK